MVTFVFLILLAIVGILNTRAIGNVREERRLRWLLAAGVVGLRIPGHSDAHRQGSPLDGLLGQVLSLLVHSPRPIRQLTRMMRLR